MAEPQVYNKEPVQDSYVPPSDLMGNRQCTGTGQSPTTPSEMDYRTAIIANVGARGRALIDAKSTSQVVMDSKGTSEVTAVDLHTQEQKPANPKASMKALSPCELYGDLGTFVQQICEGRISKVTNLLLPHVLPC